MELIEIPSMAIGGPVITIGQNCNGIIVWIECSFNTGTFSQNNKHSQNSNAVLVLVSAMYFEVIILQPIAEV